MSSAANKVTSVAKLPNFIASNLRVLRKGEGWSQAELAERLQLNRGNIASYESGNAEPNICKTLRISKLFGVDARDLIRRDLSDPQELILSRIAHTQDEEERKQRIVNFRTEARELENLLKSSRQLFDYKLAHVDAPCATADMFVAHYEQLSELANTLLANHNELLSDLGCQCD